MHLKLNNCTKSKQHAHSLSSPSSSLLHFEIRYKSRTLPTMRLHGSWFCIFWLKFNILQKCGSLLDAFTLGRSFDLNTSSPSVFYLLESWTNISKFYPLLHCKVLNIFLLWKYYGNFWISVVIKLILSWLFVDCNNILLLKKGFLGCR